MVRSFAWATLFPVLACAGCASYEAEPLALDAHARAWEQRGGAVDVEGVASYHDALRRRAVEQPPEPFDVTDGVSLGEAEVVALALNRDLRVARARAKEATAGAAEAGHWDDPVFEADLMRIVHNVPDPWLGGFGIGFTIPLSGRLDAAEALAWAESDAAWGAVAEAEQRTLAEVGRAWRALAAARQRHALLTAYIERVEELAGRTEALVKAGELAPADARVLRLDIATRQLTLADTTAAIATHEAELRSVLGLVPDAAVRFLANVITAPSHDDVVDTDATDDDDRRSRLLEHPSMITARAAYEVAERSLRREVRQQYPDLTIGPVYENEEGQSRIGLSAGLPIPLLNRNRRGIAEALAQRDTARVRAETAYESLATRVAAERRRRDAAQRKLQRLHDDLAPLVDAQLRDLRQLIDLGEANILVVHDALERSLETKLAVLDATHELADAAAALHALLNPRWATAPPPHEPPSQTEPQP